VCVCVFLLKKYVGVGVAESEILIFE
jgi:hypothetical protein